MNRVDALWPFGRWTMGASAAVAARLHVYGKDRVPQTGGLVLALNHFSWIDVPGLGGGEPPHRRGVVDGQPGLYLVGLHFLYALSSAMIQGAGRDAEHVARHIAARVRGARPAAREPVGA